MERMKRKGKEKKERFREGGGGEEVLEWFLGQRLGHPDYYTIIPPVPTNSSFCPLLLMSTSFFSLSFLNVNTACYTPLHSPHFLMPLFVSSAPPLLPLKGGWGRGRGNSGPGRRGGGGVRLLQLGCLAPRLMELV